MMVNGFKVPEMGVYHAAINGRPGIVAVTQEKLDIGEKLVPTTVVRIYWPALNGYGEIIMDSDAFEVDAKGRCSPANRIGPITVKVKQNSKFSPT